MKGLNLLPHKRKRKGDPSAKSPLWSPRGSSPKSSLTGAFLASPGASSPRSNMHLTLSRITLHF